MKKSLLALVTVLLVGIVSVFAISPYFTDSTVDEAIPTGAILQPIMEKDDTMMEEQTMEKDDTMMDKQTMEKDDTMMDKQTMEKDDTMMDKQTNEIIPISYSGEFIGVGDGIHDAQGDAYTIPIDDGSNVLRLENFQSTNGPDLFVYLATDDTASEFINLGALKANNGNQNYEIPDEVDLDKYSKVLIWCKSFSVLFGSAQLSQ